MKAGAPAAAAPSRLLKPGPQQSKDGNTGTTSVGTLWAMNRSPFSNAVKVVLSLSGRHAKVVPFIPLLSPLLLRLRLGPAWWWGRRVSAPVLLAAGATGGVVTESMSIAAYIDAGRVAGRASLFPSEHAARIARFSAAAATLSSFMRGVMLQRVGADVATCERMFAPRWMRGRWFARMVVRLAVWVMRRKYAAESARATRDAVVRVLEEVRQALVQCPGRRLRYLCGTRVTYADIVVAESVFFDGGRHGRWREVYRDDEMEERFPDVVAWARAVRETHYKDVLGGRT